MDLVGVVALACVVPVASADDLVLGRPTCRVDNPSFILVAAAAALVVVAGVGGKGLRDVIADQIPEVLRDAQNYASAAPLPAVHSRMSFSLISTSNVLAAFWIPIIAIFAARMVTLNLGFRYRRSLSRSRGPVTGGAIGRHSWGRVGGLADTTFRIAIGAAAGSLSGEVRSRTGPPAPGERGVSAGLLAGCDDYRDMPRLWIGEIAHRVVGPREATPTSS
jgi:hypothetical protein